jgi:hypothetical protein
MTEARVTTQDNTAYRRELRARRRAQSADELMTGRLFVTVPEAAVILDSDERSVRRAIDAGDIPFTPVGPRKLVPVSWLRRAAGLDTTGAGH